MPGRISPSLLEQRDQSAREISERLALLRQWLGFSEAEMASRLGIGLRAYRRRELSGRHRWIDTYSIVCLAEATGVSLDWLVAGGYPDQPKSRAPFDRYGRRLRPRLRVVASGR